MILAFLTNQKKIKAIRPKFKKIGWARKTFQIVAFTIRIKQRISGYVFCIFSGKSHENQSTLAKIKKDCLGPENILNCYFYKKSLTAEIGVWMFFFFLTNHGKIQAILSKLKKNVGARKTFQIVIFTLRIKQRISWCVCFLLFFVANHTNIQAVRPKLKTHCLGPENFPNCNLASLKTFGGGFVISHNNTFLSETFLGNGCSAVWPDCWIICWIFGHLQHWKCALKYRKLANAS